jgi:flavin reductase (DIM6/NTAB) family NADH-FMN oxidoreductase RutF
LYRAFSKAKQVLVSDIIVLRLKPTPEQEEAFLNEDYVKIDPDTMRQAMRFWATGVTVVTTEFSGERHGMTVSSFTSVSLEPPLVLVSLQNDTRTAALVQRSGVFGVTLLLENQAQISDRFAGREQGVDDRFDGLETFCLESNAPLLKEGLAALDCRVVATYPIATHTLFVGQIIAARSAKEGRPLLYFNRAYRAIK